MERKPPCRQGIVRVAWHWLAGEQDPAVRDLKEAGSHGGWMLAAAPYVSMVLMIGFSLGAVVTLAGQPLAHNLALWQQGQPLDWNEVVVLVVGVLLVIGMDWAMIAGAAYIRDQRDRGASWGELMGHVVVVALVALLETATLYLMLSQYAPHASLAGRAFVGGRACISPVVAIYLALLRPRGATRRDIEQLLLKRVGAALLSFVDRSVDAGEADYATLVEIFSLLNPSTPEYQMRDHRLMDAIGRLTDRAVAEKTVRETLHALSTSLGALEPVGNPDSDDRDASGAGKFARGEVDSAASNDILPTTGHQVPATDLPLLMASPDGGDTQMAVHMGQVTSSRRTKSDEFRARMRELEITLVPTPPGRKGVYVHAGNVEDLTDGKLAGDQARAVIKMLGDNMQTGKYYLAPFGKVLDHLCALNILRDDLRTWWGSLADPMWDAPNHAEAGEEGE